MLKSFYISNIKSGELIIHISIFLLLSGFVFPLQAQPHDNHSPGDKTTQIEKPDQKQPASEKNAPDTNKDSENTKQNEGIISLIIRGGWTMLGLGLISTIILAFSIERFLYFKRQNINTRGFNDRLKDLLQSHSADKLSDELLKENSLIGRILAYGLGHHKMGREEIEFSLEKKTNIEIAKLERGLNLLANFGNLAPLLGFFGTVVGMRTSFLQFVIQKAPTAQDLAGGVEEALITTAAGLLVAIPTYLVYNLFIYQIDHFGTEIEQSASLIHDHFKGNTPKASKNSSKES